VGQAKKKSGKSRQNWVNKQNADDDDEDGNDDDGNEVHNQQESKIVGANFTHFHLGSRGANFSPSHTQSVCGCMGEYLCVQGRLLAVFNFIAKGNERRRAKLRAGKERKPQGAPRK